MIFDIEKARFNTIEQQIRPWHVSDSQVLATLLAVKRELFVSVQHQALAFSDMELPTMVGQTMLAPKIEARLLQELRLTDNDKVLEIGTGSGYMAALIASHVQQVISVEIEPSLVTFAKDNLKRAHINHVQVEQGDAALGWEKAGEVDAICVSASVPIVPQSMLDQLKIGGRLVAIVGDFPNMKALRITRNSVAEFVTTELFETQAHPLKNAQQPNRFKF